LENVLSESKKEIEQKQSMQNDYQNYVDKLQKQVENLVDVINNLTEERESSFKKIENLESKNKGRIFRLQKQIKKINAFFFL
jgi:peptidoglycan hydrolase CwlO-like protein